MRQADVYRAEIVYDEADPDGYRSGMARVGQQVGARELTVKLFEIPAGQSLCPYHYEYVEEWLLVLAGEVMVRTSEGTARAGPGALVCFPAGPGGAHKLTNQSAHPSRLLMFSSAREPAVAVYPDSDKIGVWPGREEDAVMMRRSDGQVSYYEGEV